MTDMHGDGVETVLVVDDQPANVKVLSASLIAAGYKVLAAYDGEMALAMTAEHLPDLILLDVMMPGMNGFEVTKRLKEDAKTAGIPIVLVTALDAVKDKVQGLEAGADDFLSKPVNREELLARARSLLQLKKNQELLHGKVAAIADSAMLDRQDPATGKMLLVIEDDPQALKNYELILIHEGYRVVTAKNGAEAMDLLDQAVPDCILLDLMLPDIHGLKLLKWIRSRNELAAVPVLIISSIDDLQSKVSGIDNGADDYLIKPVNYAEMQARIRANIRKYSSQQRLEQDLENIYEKAIHDPLTRLFNRYYLQDVLGRFFSQAIRYDQVFSLLMLDIDHFKDINDTFGHAVGDEVLKELAATVKRLVRDSDTVARYGGEEFVVLCPHADREEACKAAEKIRAGIEQHVFPCLEDKKVTVSIGVGSFMASDKKPGDILKRADDNLYSAKDQGRNRVIA